MDILIRKWNNFFNLPSMGFIPLHGHSPLINGSKLIFLHSESSWLDLKLEEFAICQNSLNMDILIRKWNKFFNITPMRFIQLYEILSIGMKNQREEDALTREDKEKTRCCGYLREKTVHTVLDLK